MISNLELICKHFFDNTDLDVVNHNLTHHATLEGTEHIYVANIVYNGMVIMVDVDIMEMANNCVSISDCSEYLNIACNNAIFKYQLSEFKLTEEEIEDETIY